MNLGYVLGITVLFSFVAPVCAAPFPVGCPDSVPVKQELTSQITGWTAKSDKLPYRLRSITFFDGPLEDAMSLVYDATVRGGSGKETAIWHFGPGKGRLIWVSCGYFGTSVTLAKSLPADVNSCSVIYNSRQLVGGSPLIEEAICK